MGRPGKFYCHYEPAEVTTPFVIEPGLTFAAVAESFCAKYNAKQGSSLGAPLSAANVELKVGGKTMTPSDEVAEHVSSGDDVYVAICAGGAGDGASNGTTVAAAPAPPPAVPSMETQASSSESEAPPVRMKLAKKIKVYVHYEAAAESRDPTATTMMQIEDACKSVGEVIVEFTEGYNAKHMGVEGFVPLLPRLLCARNDSCLIVPADASVAKTFGHNDDIWIVPLEDALKENNQVATVEANANAILASQQSRKEKSYYYWAQKPTDEAPAPREAPKQIRKREARPEELENFKTISSYSFENDGGWVKVYIMMKGVGELSEDAIKSEFAERSCSVKIMGYQGKDHRLQVPKLSEEIIPEQCEVKKRKDSVLIKLKKKRDDHHWFELFKTKGIGE